MHWKKKRITVKFDVDMFYDNTEKKLFYSIMF